LIKDALLLVLEKRSLSPDAPLDWEQGGRFGSIFKNTSKITKPVLKSKAKDEKREREADQKSASSDLKTQCNIAEIDTNEYNLNDDDGGASHVSGKSGTDDTLQKLDDLK
jgi:hypothetical protein